MVSAISCSQGRDFSAKSVVDTPAANGLIALQRMPNLPTSRATVRVNPITPSRDEAWAIDPGWPNPEPELVLTMLPEPWRAICGVAARIIAK